MKILRDGVPFRDVRRLVRGAARIQLGNLYRHGIALCLLLLPLT